ncbi:MAG TPA: 50S ribosomal protein L6 [Thermoleophilia bacterium]|jgi:large subunit ribosomal protein L6|nr:50S ribosomal protein L6 [Actinomycetota bacterium]OPZ47104.1 MAG: 50S ribosomal protein L6 [Actinobacteria bacterium ADurb.BinA094]HQF51363.1 50S ribosomal protein L6 [Thermoleophilia bacterium]HQJ25616.1 50S ribosomal protein L6 [Thermoleophilia bacterium]
MSRIGKAPIPLPDSVEFKYDNAVVTVKGPKGELTQRVPREMLVEVGEGVIEVKRPSDSGQHRSLHGLTRSLIANMVTGVTDGFEKRLEIVGVGYRASIKGDALELLVGYSHPVVIEPPDQVTFETPQQTVVVVKGIDKQVVGEVAAKVRSIRPPEPYKGKGIRYAGEHVQRKAGKRA